MTTTSSVASTTASSTTLTQPAGAVGKQDLDQNDFMKLFITQLQYQDPMKPMDNYEMASQMAQFSTLQATTKMSTDMENLLNYQTSQNNLQLVSLIGNNVEVAGNAIGVVNGKPNTTEFDLADPAKEIQVTVYDQNNQPVWQQSLGSKGAGTYQLSWDGSNAAGKQVADGLYTYQVQATDATGALLPDTSITSHSSGKVTGVDFNNGVATVAIDNLTQAKVSDIIRVMNSSSESLSADTGGTTEQQPTGTATTDQQPTTTDTTVQ